MHVFYMTPGRARVIEIEKKNGKEDLLLISVRTLEIRLTSLLFTLTSSREPLVPNAGSIGVLPHPTVGGGGVG